MNMPFSIKQIIVVTDGCSNQGENPSIAAEWASKSGISVNTIGILQRDFNEDARREVEAIAQAGEGIAEIITMDELSYTMQNLTRRSVQMTVEKAIHRQLVSIVGPDGIAAVSPAKRQQVVGFWENLCEESVLHCLILVDASASMKTKLRQVEKSVGELFESLHERKGSSYIAVAIYPGDNAQACRLLAGFTSRVDDLRSLIQGLKVSGNTPTGPAIRHAVNLFSDKPLSGFGECVV